MLKINPSRHAVKFVEHIPAKHQQQLAKKMDALRYNPLPQDSTVLRGYNGYRRVDAGEYRIIYHYDNETLFIDVIVKRNDDAVYRAFKRQH